MGAHAHENYCRQNDRGCVMTREEAMTAYGLIPMPKIESKQMNAGHDHSYGLYVNDRLIGIHDNDVSSEATVNVLKSALSQRTTT